jgi:hypothetical protein
MSSKTTSVFKILLYLLNKTQIVMIYDYLQNYKQICNVSFICFSLKKLKQFLVSLYNYKNAFFNLITFFFCNENECHFENNVISHGKDKQISNSSNTIYKEFIQWILRVFMIWSDSVWVPKSNQIRKCYLLRICLIPN